MLFIGDPFQLLPLGHGDNPIFKLKKQYKLTEIVRQAKDSNIIKLATKIRNRIEAQDYIDLRTIISNDYGEEVELFSVRADFLKSYYSNDNWDKEDKILASYTNKNFDDFNTLIRNRFWKEHGLSKPRPFITGDRIRFNNALNVESVARLQNPTLYHNGEEVILTKVEFIHHEQLMLKFWKCTVSGRCEKDFFRVIDPDNISTYNNPLEQYIQLAKSARCTYCKSYWKDYSQLKSAFADVQYTFAFTIHKLQGSTYDTAYIDLASLMQNKQLSNDLVYRLAYVAVTRARKNIKILY